MIWNFCINRPILTLVMFLAITIFGVFGYTQMPLREYPDVEFPVVNVSVVLPGADPEVMETEVVEPLEEQLNTIDGIEELTSTSRESVGQVTVEFELDRDVDIAAQDVRDRVSRARPNMADGIEEPMVRKVDPDARAIMWITLTGTERWDLVSLTQYSDDVVQNRLERLAGVGQIFVGGYDYAVRIELEPDKLAAHRLTPQEVIQTVQQENVEIPSGRIESEQREFLVKVRGRLDSAEQFKDLVIDHRDGSPVRLADVAHVREGLENERSVTRFNQEPSVGLGIIKQADANMLDLADRLRSTMEELSEELPPGITYEIASDDSVFVEESIRDLFQTIFIATALVMLMVLLFLGSIRGALITSVAIPASLLAGMALIFYLGFSINVLTMLGFILVIGIVVDDAIVVLERCYRHMEFGADSRPAARTGTTEIAFATIANSLAMASVFIPVAFMPGMIGRFFNEFGLTVAMTVFASTFTALTLTTMLCSRYLRAAPQERKPLLLRLSTNLFSFLEATYKPVLRAALKWRSITVAVAVVAFGCGIFLLTLLESEFTPDVDESQFMVSFEAVEGATLQHTDRYARQIEDAFERVPEIRSYFLAIGLSRAGPGEVNQGFSFVQLTHHTEREASQQEIMARLRDKLDPITGVRTFVRSPGPGPGGGQAPLEVAITHSDLDVLAEQRDEIMQWMRGQPEFVGVNTDMELDRPEVEVTIDRDRAREMGLTVSSISNTLRYMFAEPTISRIERDAELYDVITEISEKPTVPETINNLYVRNRDGEMISLQGVVDIEEGVGPSSIHRFNRARSATISSQTPPDVPLGTALNKLENYLEQELPAEFDTELTGEAQDFEESFFYLTMALAFAVLFIYLVLAANFESLLHPFTILMTLPLAGVGAFGGLFALGMTLNIFSFIGVIMLLGLVTKNGILLVDFANILMARGYSRMEAAYAAGEARFRPVVMTAVSTMLGMLPIALGYGAGGEARAPMGVAISVGMLASTALTMLVIPVVYTLFGGAQEKIRQRKILSLLLLAPVAAVAAAAYFYLL